MKKKFITKKSLGQNWLINPRALDRIEEAGEIDHDDIIIEVGPGKGNLTERLAKNAGQVIAIEKDRRLISELQNKFSNSPNIKIIEGDILKFNPAQCSLITDHYKIVANIPYYVTSNFIRTVFEKWPRPKLIVLTIQKEVAQRIVSRPPDMNLLALSVQFYSEPKIIGYLSPGNFRPMPKVDSAIIILKPKKEIYPNKDKFFTILKTGFSSKRKKLINNLSSGLDVKRDNLSLWFTKSSLSLNSRPEELSLGDWVSLTDYITL